VARGSKKSLRPVKKNIFQYFSPKGAHYALKFLKSTNGMPKNIIEKYYKEYQKTSNVMLISDLLEKLQKMHAKKVVSKIVS